MNTPKEILKRYWGYESFRPLQSEIIGAVLDKRDTLALLPTGGGKSVCFQVPALCLDGICMVISPLIALMKDQVEQLRKKGIKAAAVYSGMDLREIDIILDNCIYGDMKFIYVSPERITTELFRDRASQMKISMLAVDEAHCISQWGYDFRPSYLKIAEFRQELEIDRVIALTASATREVKTDIQEKLEMKEAAIFQQSFARSNLSYSVFQLENKEEKMLEILQRVPGSSVVYVRSRKQSKEIATYLRSNRIIADYYHAGLSGTVRANKQDAWISNAVRVMVATNAFGMGIDKPDVRTVIHYDIPDSLEAYYQEAGRAGRDERKAYAVQLFASSDLENHRRRAEQSAVGVEFIRRVYQGLANYFKLAVGSNTSSSFEFDYKVFADSFDLPVIETFHALNKLVDQGLIQLSDSFKENSKLFFNLDQPEVYKYQVANRAMDPVIKVLLRLYGGEVFSDFVAIKEKDIASLLNEPVNAAIQQLEYLHKSEVIVYQRASDQPRITFLTPRYDAASLPVDVKQIEWRREVTLKKAELVRQYVLNQKICRSRILQNYFDEQTDQDCGVCDTCISNNKAKNKLPLAQLEAFIQARPRTEDQIKKTFSSTYSFDDLMNSLRFLLDQKRIFQDDQALFHIVRD